MDILVYMSKVELHFTPDQLKDINEMMRVKLLNDLRNRGIFENLPSDQVDDELRVMNNYFDDIKAILSEGEFIQIDKGSIIDEMF